MKQPNQTGDGDGFTQLLNYSEDLRNRSQLLQEDGANQSKHIKRLYEESELLILRSRQMFADIKNRRS